MNTNNSLLKEIENMNINKGKNINTIKESIESNSEEFSIDKLRNSKRFTTGRTYHKTKNFYPKPSFLDTQFEEERFQFTYQPDILYDWNLDGLTEWQVYNFLNEMGTAISTYKSISKTDQEAAQMIILGFKGTLKG